MLTIVDDDERRRTYAMGDTLAALIGSMVDGDWYTLNELTPRPLPIVVDMGLRFGALTERRRRGRHEIAATVLGQRWHEARRHA